MCTNVLTYLQWHCKAYPVGLVTVRIVESELEERDTELSLSKWTSGYKGVKPP